MIPEKVKKYRNPNNPESHKMLYDYCGVPPGNKTTAYYTL